MPGGSSMLVTTTLDQLSSWIDRSENSSIEDNLKRLLFQRLHKQIVTRAGAAYGCRMSSLSRSK